MSALKASAVTLAIALSACGGSSKQQATGPRASSSSYAVYVGTTPESGLGNDFSGNYILLTGTRSVAADSKYPCLSQFSTCQALSATGKFAGDEAIQDLCPSDDTPVGTWDFTYQLHTNATCTAPMANIPCPNTVGETLNQGTNVNYVVCSTNNAFKVIDLCVVDRVTGAGSANCPTGTFTGRCSVDNLLCGTAVSCITPQTCTAPL